MLDTEVFLSIVVVYVMIVISPGPNFVLVSRYSLRGCIRGAVGLTLGFALGATINACLTMFGVGAVVVAVPALGLLVSILGGGFLSYLGIVVILGAVRERCPGRVAEGTAGDGSPREIDFTLLADRFPSGVRKGVIVNLLNPKGIVFFIGLYAPLMAKSEMPTKLAVLVTGFSIEIIWYLVVILVLSQPRCRDAYERAGPAVDLALGAVLTLVGVRTMIEAGNFAGSI